MTDQEPNASEPRAAADRRERAAGNGQAGFSDPIDQAIADASRVRMVNVGTVRIHVSGRPFSMQIPADLTEAEALAICRFVATLPEELAKASKPNIIVPRVVVPS